jgi:tetratricopeptide (TPR) repeat protein
VSQTSERESAADGLDDSVRRVVALIELNRLDQARTELVSLLADHPDSGLFWHLLALVEFHAGAHPAALEAVHSSIAAGQGGTDVLTLRARILAGLDRDAEAVEAAEQVLAVDPENVEAHVVIARLLAVAKREYERALHNAHRARELAPENPEVHAVLGIVMLSKESWRQAGRAREPLRAATRLDPNNVDALHALALADLRRRRPGRAVRGFASVLQLSPQSTVAAYNLPLAVWVYLMRLRWSVLGVLLLAMTGAVLASQLDEESELWPALGMHLAAVLIVVAAAWLLLALRTVKAFPPSMRTAALLLLRRDPLARLMVLGKFWVIVCCLLMTSVPWWHPGMIGACAVAGYLGYFLFLMAARFRLGKMNRAADAERTAAWSRLPGK